MAVIAKEELAELVKTALLKAGVPEKSSDIIADITIQAQLRGISSHGVQMIPVYLERIKRGGLNPLAEPVVEKKSDTVWSVDGNGAFGQLAGYCAAQLIIENVKKGLPGMAGVKNSNHCGMLAYYTELIADAGAVGFMTTNTNPNVAARRRFLEPIRFPRHFRRRGKALSLIWRQPLWRRGSCTNMRGEGSRCRRDVQLTRRGIRLQTRKKR